MYNRIILLVHIECFIKILKYQITSKMIFFSLSYCIHIVKLWMQILIYDFLLYVKNLLLYYIIFLEIFIFDSI